MVAILEKRKLRDFDWLLTLMALAIALFGTWMIYHAQPEVGYWKKQLIGLGVSAVVMLGVAFTDYRKLVHIAPAWKPEVAAIALIENVGFGGTWAAPAVRSVYDVYVGKHHPGLAPKTEQAGGKSEAID